MVMCCPLSSSSDSCYGDVSQLIVLADEDYVCGECGEQIPAGVPYECYKGRNPDYDEDEGDIDTHNTCTLCVEIRDHFVCDGWIFGQLWEDLEENFFPDMRMGGPCMAGLSPAAKSALVDARLEWMLSGLCGVHIPVALPPWWRWWYGDADPCEGRQ